MKNIVLTIAGLFIFHSDTIAQAVPKKVVLEHFTNTFCSVCANRNPGLYANLAHHPDVYHVAYYPSSPYPSCTLNQHNTSENDARTNFYNVYGSTPRIALQGVALPVQTQFFDTTLFNAAMGQLSSFKITTEFEQLNSATIRVNTLILKVDTSSLTSADIYGAIVEDTLDFVSNNGEQHHYDVFRKGVWGSGVTGISLPTMLNTSVSMTQDITIHNDWNLNRLYTMVMLQNPDKTLIQAERSANLGGVLAMETMSGESSVTLYPNPAHDHIDLIGLGQPALITITDVSGRQVLTKAVSATNTSLDVSALTAGVYFLSVKTAAGVDQLKLIKN